MTEYSESERNMLEKYHPGCLRGDHVPVAGIDKHNRILEVYCQNCLIPMTKEEHKDYFRNRSDIQPDYDNPGDPSDVDIFTSTAIDPEIK